MLAARVAAAWVAGAVLVAWAERAAQSVERNALVPHLVAWFVEETEAAAPGMLPGEAFAAAAAAFVAAAAAFAVDTAVRFLAVQTMASLAVRPRAEAPLAVEAALVALGGLPASVALQTRGTAR